MDSRIPEPVRPVLREYLRRVDEALPGLLESFYLHGSLALGAFNLHSSDVDFIAVLGRRCTEEELERLRGIHAAMAQEYPKWELSGSYLQWGDLGRLDHEVPASPGYFGGRFDAGRHHDLNDVTWWLLKNRGIGLRGPEPEALPFRVNWERLVTRMHENLNDYWGRFTWDPPRMARLLTDAGLQWAVLGVLRLHYTFREHDITSKTCAGEYALRHLPPGRHRIIREAIRIRERSGKPEYRSRLVRAVDAWSLLLYVIRLDGTRRL